MKKGKENTAFDEVIGVESPRELTKKEHDQIRENRRKIYDNRSAESKVDDIVAGFRFTLKKYAQTKTPEEIIFLGQFLNTILKEINVKKGTFAKYIDISPRNINKYFNGDRKFNIEHVLKLEKMFDVHAEILLEIQLKNELLKAKNSSKKNYSNYNLKDLLPS